MILIHLQAVSPLPVMVFLHGGGYVSGSGSRLLYGPELFMDRQVIPVIEMGILMLMLRILSKIPWLNNMTENLWLINHWLKSLTRNPWLNFFWLRWFWCASTFDCLCLADSTFLGGRRLETRWWGTRWKPVTFVKFDNTFVKSDNTAESQQLFRIPTSISMQSNLTQLI